MGSETSNIKANMLYTSNRVKEMVLSDFVPAGDGPAELRSSNYIKKMYVNTIGLAKLIFTTENVVKISEIKYETKQTCNFFIVVLKIRQTII